MYAYHTCPHKIQYTMWKPKDTQDISQRHMDMMSHVPMTLGMWMYISP